MYEYIFKQENLYIYIVFFNIYIFILHELIINNTNLLFIHSQ